MPRAAAISAETLVPLGAEALAKLVLDGVARDAAFKRVVSAALAATKGPKAVAALVEKRLAGLERARGFVEWDKIKAFAADLDATVTSIVDGIGGADPALATTTLLRFIGLAYNVFERVDDSQGRVQTVYKKAMEALGTLTGRLSARDRAALPPKIGAALGMNLGSWLALAVQVVGPHLDAATLAAWDAQLAKPSGPLKKGRDAAWEAEMRAEQALAARQMIAFTRRDLDAFATLEATKPPGRQNSLAIANLFYDAGRPADALNWLRKKATPTIRYLRQSDLSDGTSPLDVGRLDRTSLETKVLDALGDKTTAQALRWSTFADTLDPEMARDYMAGLGEFEEFDALDRIFAHVEAATNIHRALTFLAAWPRLDKAAALVVRHRTRWNGDAYDVLGPIAEDLEAEHPAAAALLYRRLLDTILKLSRANAYGHGVRFLARLDTLARDLDEAALPDVPNHVTYRLELTKAHGRKSAFWAKVKA